MAIKYLNIEDIKPNSLRKVDGIIRKETPEVRDVDMSKIPPLPENHVYFTEDELDDAKRILTKQVELKELLSGKYSTVQMAKMDKTSGIWTLVKLIARFLMKII